MLRCRRGATAQQEVMGAARNGAGGPLPSPEDTATIGESARGGAAGQSAQEKF